MLTLISLEIDGSDITSALLSNGCVISISDLYRLIHKKEVYGLVIKDSRIKNTGYSRINVINKYTKSILNGDTCISDIHEPCGINTVHFVKKVIKQTSGSNGSSENSICLDELNRLCVCKINNSLDRKVNELLYTDLAKLFGVPCCKTELCLLDSQVGVLSYVEGDFTSFASLSKLNRWTLDSKYGNSVLWAYKNLGQTSALLLYKALVFDTFLRQEDRHLHNFGFLNNNLYPMFDNERCLFYDKTIEQIERIWFDCDPDWVLPTLVGQHHHTSWKFMCSQPVEKRKALFPDIDYRDILWILLKYKDRAMSEILTRYIFTLYQSFKGEFYTRIEG